MSGAAISLTGGVVRRGRATVLAGADFEARAGEVVGVLGPNGAGKTTLLRAALGLTPLSAGEARLGGRLVGELGPAHRAKLAGYLPQERRVSWSLPAARIASLGAFDQPPAVALEIALGALERVGLRHLADRGVLEMSGGERARVLLARLLATRAPLMVADEPAAGLDPEAQLLALELLAAEAARGGAVVVTLHDLTLAARVCDRLVVLHRGAVAAEGPPREALTPKVLREVFALDGELVDTPAGVVLAARRTA